MLVVLNSGVVTWVLDRMARAIFMVLDERVGVYVAIWGVHLCSESFYVIFDTRYLLTLT